MGTVKIIIKKGEPPAEWSGLDWWTKEDWDRHNAYVEKLKQTGEYLKEEEVIITFPEELDGMFTGRAMLKNIGFLIPYGITISRDADTNKFTFWKDNRIDGKFQMSLTEIRPLFINWMKTKDKDWLEYYSGTLVNIFITSNDGLSSVFDDKEFDNINVGLRETKWQYLNSIGIK